jgi:hypothetical protein
MSIEIKPLEAEFNFPKIPSNIDKEMTYFILELRNFLHRKFVERLVIAGDLQIGGDIIQKTEIVSGIVRAKITQVNAATLTCLVDASTETVQPIFKMDNALTGNVSPKYSVNDFIAVFKSNNVWYTVCPFADTIEFE